MRSHAPLQRSGGYVLLLTLVLLAMVATSLAAVARRSHAASVAATRLERETQRRWLTTSSEALLPELESMLEPPSDPATYSDPHPTQTGVVSLQLDLGHHTLQLTLADEQAKANLNALWARHDPAVVRAKTSVLLTDIGTRDIPQLRPLGSFEATAAGSETNWPVFVVYEQILPPKILRQQLLGDVATNSVTLLDAVTLWGDGRLHVQTATRPALDMILTPLLSPGQVDQFEWLRIESSDSTEPIRIEDLDLTDRQREQLAPLITSTSSCHSVRLQLDDGRRRYTHLAVLQVQDNDEPSPLIRMSW